MLTQSVVKGASWLFVGRIGASLVGLVSMIALARLLTPADFGVVALAASVFAIVSAFVELPTGVAMIQLKDIEDDDFHTAWTLGVLKGVAVAVVMLVLAWPMSWLFHEPRLTGLISFLAVYPIVLGLRNPFFEAYARDMSFSREVVVDIVSKIASFLATISIAVMFRTYWAMPAGMVASGVIATLLTFLYARRHPKFSLGSFRRVFGFSAWLGASSAINQINIQSDTLMVGGLLGKATLGQVSMGGQFVNRIEEVTRAPLFRSLFSAFSSIQSDPDRIRRAYLSSQAMCVAALLPVGLGLGAVAQPLVLLVLGDQWGLAAIVAVFCGVAQSVYCFTAACQPLAMSLGQTRVLFFRDLANMCIRVSALLAGLILGGPIGLMIGMLLSAVVMTAISATLVKKLTGLSLAAQINNCRRSLIAGVLMFVSVFALSTYVSSDGDFLIRIASLAALVTFGALFYAVAHLALWRLDKFEEGPETKVMGFVGHIRSRLAHVQR